MQLVLPGPLRFTWNPERLSIIDNSPRRSIETLPDQTEPLSLTASFPEAMPHGQSIESKMRALVIPRLVTLMAF